MDVTARNYHWSEFCSKVCYMCDKGEDETVEHVMLECEKYQRDRLEMMEVAVSEMGWDVNEVIEITEKEWMVLLLGLSGEASERMVEAVKRFLERVWCARSRA